MCSFPDLPGQGKGAFTQIHPVASQQYIFCHLLGPLKLLLLLLLLLA
jgi:hypothetical protein